MTARPLVAGDASTARSSVVVSASFLLANLFGGLLALLIALIVGEGPRTDGFLAAYSAYLTFLLFGSNLRVALVPLLGSTADEPSFRRHSADTTGRLIAAGLVMSGVLALASPGLGRALVPGAPPTAQTTAVVSVAILAGAAACQIWAAALSAVLAASRRFVTSALLYAASTAVTVAVAGVLMVLAGIWGAAIGVFGSALALLAGHVAYLRRFGFGARPRPRVLRERRTWRLVASAAAGASVPIAFQVNLSVALAAVSTSSGAVTGYAYAYFIAATLSGITSATIGLTTMPQLVQALRERGRAVAGEYLDDVAPFSVFLYLPLAAGYASFGHPFLDGALGGSLTPATIELLWDASRIFLVMALAWAVLAPVTTLALSLELFGGLAVISAALVVVQVALVVGASALGGPVTVAAAHAVSGILLTLLALALVFGGRGPAVGLRVLWRCLPPGAFALVYPALALTGLAAGIPGAALGLVLGSALYLGLAVALWPSVGRRALRLLRSRP